MPIDTNLLPSLSSKVADCMVSDFHVFYDTDLVSTVLLKLRASSRQPDGIKYLYVVDSSNCLIGVLPTRRLLYASLETFVKDIMISPVLKIIHTATFGQAAALMRSNKLLALPVVDSENKILGIVDVTGKNSAFLDIERRETLDRIFQLVGVHLDLKPNASVFIKLKDRFPWLICNIISGVVAALLVGIFDDLLQTVVVLTFFIPVVLALAESVAMQSLTISVQKLKLITAGRTSRLSVKRSTRELFIGGLLGFLSGGLVALTAQVWKGDIKVSLIIAATICLGCAYGALFGYIIPQVVHRLNMDIKISSGPAALALTDLFTIVSYMMIAQIVF